MTMPLRRFLLLMLPAAAQMDAQVASQIRVVSQAASYETVVAPNSLASVFGTGLSASTAVAQLDAAGQLPAELGGIVVEVNGIASRLIYVSPSQINFVVPASAAPGTAAVVVRAASSAAGLQGAVPVAFTAPGLFSLDATGKGAGAILNAVTFSAGPFLVETPENGGGDRRTRLAGFATGLRYAGNPGQDAAVINVAGFVQAQARDSSGRVFPLAVEYAGPAPGFFGLDQVNLVLPPEADGAGTLSLTIAAASPASNAVTFSVAPLPAGAIRLANFSLSQTMAAGAADLSGTASLNAPARTGGVSITLQSDNPAVRAPLTIAIPQGQVSAQFPVHADAVFSAQTARLSASAKDVTLIATLALEAANASPLASFTVSPAAVAGGMAAMGTVRLSGAAPAGGATVQLTSDNAAAQLPASVSIPFGQISAVFPIATAHVTSAQSATLTARYGTSIVTAPLAIDPPLSLALSSSSVRGGADVAATARLGTPAGIGGASIAIRSDNPAAIAPVLLPIAAGQSSAAFTIRTLVVSAPTPVIVTASYAGATSAAMLTLTPVAPAALAAVTVTPAVVTGGTPVAGMVTLTDPAPVAGFTVAIESSAFSVAQPATPFVTIPSGQTSAAFVIHTNPAPAPTKVTITATGGGVSKTAALTVQ